MRVLVIGRSGQVARALQDEALNHPGLSLTCIGRPDLDLESAEAVDHAVLAARPDLLVNAAAYTAVDTAEREAERAFAVNCHGARRVAEAAARHGLPLLHLSTDYVFDGSKQSPYLEDDATGPLNVYGASKLAGEVSVMSAHPRAVILRTSWVFSAHGHNFLTTMMRLAHERQVLKVVSDQFGNPTAANDLAGAILRIAPRLARATGKGGIHHYCGDGSTSRFGFADFILAESKRLGGPCPTLQPIRTPEYPTPARRPANSSLDTSAFARCFGFSPPSWRAEASRAVAVLLRTSRPPDHP
ncbi:MAG: dTDP-4-dehydrorhamnose reductase [Rhizobiales bacterium]|nr:dTDP-4-dehydrorhamnose reductase [Hyphomicrobiales bacterium]